MCLDVISAIFTTQICLLKLCLSFKLSLHVSFGWVASISEKLHVTAGTFDIFLNFYPNFLVLKIATPQRRLAIR